MRIDLPPDRAAVVLGVTLSGRACPAVAQCTTPEGTGCAQYTFVATADGACDVDLTFSSPPSDFNASLTFAQVSTCCPGYYVQPTTASPIEVPSIDLDAGADG